MSAEPDAARPASGTVSAPIATRKGCFVAVVGPSGAGKDALLGAAAADLRDDPRILFSRRIVTRKAVADVEDHDVMTAARFAQAEQAGRFGLTWHAHGLSYALPRTLASAVAAGRIAIANVSRRVLSDALERFGRLVVVEITAPEPVLLARIVGRGRESEEQASERLSRRIALDVPAGTEAVHRIVNDGPLVAGAATLIEIIRSCADRVDEVS